MNTARAAQTNAIAFAMWRHFKEQNFNPLNCLHSRTYNAKLPHAGHCPVFLVLFFFASSTETDVVWGGNLDNQIWWLVLSGILYQKLLKFCSSFFKLQSITYGMFSTFSAHVSAYFVRSVFPRYCRSTHWWVGTSTVVWWPVVWEIFVSIIIKMC